jgi:ATP-binding cassette subfamily G (WHITE) protein 2 (SNQ2)
MSQGDDGAQVSNSPNTMLEDLGNPEYLHAVLDLADPPIASASQADRREPQEGRGRNRPHAVSCASHINVDYFDPRGVGALRQTLSRMSTAPSDRTQIRRPDEVQAAPSQRPPIAEEAGEAFDFEEVLHDVLRR